jgi:hypothetical protein
MRDLDTLKWIERRLHLRIDANQEPDPETSAYREALHDVLAEVEAEIRRATPPTPAAGSPAHPKQEKE